ncbi:MAG: CoA pyrophosphatase [Candidatus Binataceae bacterium]|nr:CoA pyrophosphatase [Candidatus Binataceae bacterium]
MTTERALTRLRNGLLDPLAIRSSEGERLAAVLVPIFEHAGELHVLYITRADHLSSHRGQVAFPGGRVDPTDKTVMAAALRETWEEVGIEQAAVAMLGAFPEARTATTGIIVAPFVGRIPWPVALRANPDEVAEIFTVPISALRAEQYRGLYTFRRNGLEWKFPAIIYDGRPIWGLTYRITINLLELMDESRAVS